MQIWGNPVVSVFMCLPGLLWVCGGVYWMLFKERTYTQECIVFLRKIILLFSLLIFIFCPCYTACSFFFFFHFFGLQNHCRWWLQPWNEKMLAPWKKSYDQPRQHIKKQGHYFANKGLSSQSYGFSSGHVWICKLGYKESWVPKNWCFWTVVLEKTLESPLDFKEIQAVNPKGNQSWIFIGRTDASVEAPIFWCSNPPDAKNWLTGKDSDGGKDWEQEEKGMTQDEMVGRHHLLDGHEFE